MAGQPADSALSKTEVFVYATADDRSNNLPGSLNGITDSSGLVVFSNLTLPKYYLRINNPTFGVKDDDVNTPPDGVALDEVDY